MPTEHWALKNLGAQKPRRNDRPKDTTDEHKARLWVRGGR